MVGIFAARFLGVITQRFNKMSLTQYMKTLKISRHTDLSINRNFDSLDKELIKIATLINSSLGLTHIDGGPFIAEKADDFWDGISKELTVDGGDFIHTSLAHMDGGAFI